MPKYGGSYKPAKIFHNEQWKYIAEHIYHNGQWIKINYWLESITMISPPAGSRYSLAVTATIRIQSSLIA